MFNGRMWPESDTVYNCEVFCGFDPAYGCDVENGQKLQLLRESLSCLESEERY